MLSVLGGTVMSVSDQSRVSTEAVSLEETHEYDSC